MRKYGKSDLGRPAFARYFYNRSGGKFQLVFVPANSLYQLCVKDANAVATLRNRPYFAEDLLARPTGKSFQKNGRTPLGIGRF